MRAVPLAALLRPETAALLFLAGLLQLPTP
jgi:hypothetical protein